MLGKHDFILSDGTSAPAIRWTSVRKDGSLLAMHEDRLLRRWHVHPDEFAQSAQG